MPDLIKYPHDKWTVKNGDDSDLSMSDGSFSTDEIEMILSGLWRLADTAGNYGDGETKRAANKLHDKIKKMNTKIGQSDELK